MSDLTSPSVHLGDARPFMSRGIVIYFCVLCALTVIAVVPDAITAGLFLFILPGLILIASATLLYYSIALLPAYLISRHLGKHLLAAAVAAISVAAAAILPHYVSGFLLGRLVASDHADPPPASQPRSFELPYQDSDVYWTTWRGTPGNWPPPACADLCQQLLFKGNVDQVIVRDHANPLSAATVNWNKSKLYRVNADGWKEIPIAKPPGETRPFRLKVRRFRLQQRETCPESLSIIKGEFARDVIGGRCLIEDTIESADADVVLSISEPPVGRSSYQNLLRNDPCKGGAVLSRIEDGPTTVIILERRGDRMIPAEAKTTLVAQYAAMPLHFRPVFRGLNSCLVTASDPFPANFADPYEMIGRRYHLPIAKAPDSDRLSAISAVPFSDGDRTLVKAILERDASAHMSKTESRLVASFVNARLKSGKLNDDDIELIRALLKQHGFTAPIETRLPPSTYQALKLLLPGMFERVAYRADEQSQIVQSLDQMLDHFPAEDIDPYLATLCGGGKNGDLRVCYMREFRTGHKN